MKAGQKFDVFTVDEIQELENILSRLPDSKAKNTLADNYTNGFLPSHPIHKMLMKKVYPKLKSAISDEFELACGILLKANDPFNIHTDYRLDFDKSSIVVGPAVIIPLSITPDNIKMNKTHTVIFDQECTNNFKIFKENNKPIVQSEISAVHLHNTFCSHCTIEDLSYLTVNTICEWAPGSFFYWDRRLLHTSDNFHDSGIIQKRALILFFDKKIED